MKHIIVTLNTPEAIAAMSQYSGVELIKTDDTFAIWYCVDLSQQDLAAMSMFGMLTLNEAALEQ